MNPNQQQFTKDHHDIFNYLRQALMQLHMQGVPGMHEILGQLNQTHQKYGQTQQIQQPAQTVLGRTNPGLMQDIQGMQGQSVVSTPQAYVNRQKGVVR